MALGWKTIKTKKEMKFLQNLVRIKSTILPALAGWVGLVIYFIYFRTLPHTSFMIWHSVLVVVFFIIATLVYCKFFSYFSLTVTLVIFLLTVLAADIVAFSLRPMYLSGLTSLDFILSYALMVATVSLTHTIYHKPWRKKSS